MEFIGIDVGSQGTKLVLLSHSGKILAEENSSYPIEYPQLGWAEQDPGHWETATLNGLRSIISQSKNPDKIVSIGIAAQVDGIIPIDRRGSPLHKAIVWMDRRATEEEKLIGKAIGEEEIFATTGCNLDASHVLPKILWLKNHTAILKKTYKLLVPASYILFFLTGKFGLDYANASSTLMYKVKEKVWDDDILREFAISRSLLPEIFPSTHIMGNLRKEIAVFLGLSNPPLVAVGSGDEHAACVGAGAIDEGVAFNMAGTGEVVGASSSLPLFDKSRLVETNGHSSSEHWFLENPGFVSGGNLRWFRDNLSTIGERGLSYNDLIKDAELIPPGSEGLIFLPTLMGAMVPECNSQARGNLYGLSLSSTRAHITRAILEGSAYGMKDIMEALKNMGLTFSKIRVSGGGSRSRLWNQIKADVLNLPVETLSTPETTSLGAALIGATSYGAYPNLKIASECSIKIKDVVTPSDQRTEYEHIYPRYRDLYFSIKPLFK